MVKRGMAETLRRNSAELTSEESRTSWIRGHRPAASRVRSVVRSSVPTTRPWTPSRWRHYGRLTTVGCNDGKGVRHMSVSLYFTPTGFTQALYDEANAKLEEAGAGFGKVPGRTFHCAIE